jgi:hypothetical protein
MHGICFDFPLQDWFDFKIPKTKIDRSFIEKALLETDSFDIKPSAKVIWIGESPSSSSFTKSKKGSSWEIQTLTFYDKKENFSVQLPKQEGEWLIETLEKIKVSNPKICSFQEIKADFETYFENFELFWYSKPMLTLRSCGLLVF